MEIFSGETLFEESYVFIFQIFQAPAILSAARISNHYAICEQFLKQLSSKALLDFSMLKPENVNVFENRFCYAANLNFYEIVFFRFDNIIRRKDPIITH